MITETIENKNKTSVKKEPVKKIKCKVNYNIPHRNITSVEYIVDDIKYACFVDGIYTDYIEIHYTGEFDNKNIIKIK